MAQCNVVVADLATHWLGKVDCFSPPDVIS